MKKVKVTPELLAVLEQIAGKELPQGLIDAKDPATLYQQGRGDGEVMLARMVLRTLNATLL